MSVEYGAKCDPFVLVQLRLVLLYDRSPDDDPATAASSIVEAHARQKSVAA
ncbi:hypothetical protein THAOC_33465, partial [Thalassiosira oceanica]